MNASIVIDSSQDIESTLVSMKRQRDKKYEIISFSVELIELEIMLRYSQKDMY